MRGAQPLLAAWILPALYVSDLAMLAVASLWTFAGSGDWRWVGIGALVAVGCVQALVAWRLQRLEDSSQSDPGRWPAPGEPAGGVPRLRVHFVDEIPRNRR